MKKGKKCQNCGQVNVPGAVACKRCGTDIEDIEVQEYLNDSFANPYEISQPIDSDALNDSKEDLITPNRFSLAAYYLVAFNSYFLAISITHLAFIFLSGIGYTLYCLLQMPCNIDPSIWPSLYFIAIPFSVFIGIFICTNILIPHIKATKNMRTSDAVFTIIPMIIIAPLSPFITLFILLYFSLGG